MTRSDRVPRATIWSRVGTPLIQAGIVLAVFAAWEASARTGLTDPRLLSQPTAVVQRLFSMLGGESVYGYSIYAHVWITVQELGIGYVLGALSGFLVGLLFTRSRLLTDVLEPYILASYSIPKIAIAPLFVLLFGIGIVSKIAVVTTGVFFMLFFTTYAGIVNAEPAYTSIARILGASQWQIFRRVSLPAALPSIVTGLKLSVPFAMIGAIVGEIIAAFQGLGYMILYATSTFDASALFAGIIVLVVVVWFLGLLVGVAESRLLRWQPKRQRQSISG
jgi:NitT/TauT family transport system permease protein